jgi:hypothetical protein
MRLRIVLPRIPVRFAQLPGEGATAPPSSPASEPPELSDALLPVPLLPEEEAPPELEEPPEEVPEPLLPEVEVDAPCEPPPEDVPCGMPGAPVSGPPAA